MLLMCVLIKDFSGSDGVLRGTDCLTNRANWLLPVARHRRSSLRRTHSVPRPSRKALQTCRVVAVRRCSFFIFRIEKFVGIDAQASAVFPHGLQRRGIDRNTIVLSLPERAKFEFTRNQDFIKAWCGR
jgi:hypothetical protein